MGVINSPAILRVGERSPKDKKFATDEFLYLTPGSSAVVAPRPKDVEPTLRNAVQAIKDQVDKSLSKSTRLRGAQEGTEIFAGSNLLQQLIQALTGGLTGQLATELPAVQLAIMQALGYIIPQAFGVTDPKAFQDILSGAFPGGFPKTLGLQELEQQKSLGMLNLAIHKQLGMGQLDLQKMLGLGELELGREQARATRALRQLIPATSAAIPTFGS